MIGAATILMMQVCMLNQPAKCEDFMEVISDPNHKLVENRKLCYLYGQYQAKKLAEEEELKGKRVKQWKCIKKPVRTHDV
jgi:hypothetical protein